jgi:hypothetical protein
MHAFVWDFVRALMNEGTAMAASNPMIATTIMISTNVKPDLLLFFIFILHDLLVFLLEWTIPLGLALPLRTTI